MTILSATGDLLDVNVWLALAVTGHPHHKTALQSWSTLRRPAFCRITHLSLLRLLTNKEVMGKDALGPEEAWKSYETLLAAGAARFIAEPDGIEASLKDAAKGAKAARDFWTDTYLAAFARTAGLRLVSFDTGFARLSDLDCLILKPND